MAQKPNTHEQLIRKFCQESMGLPYIFRPKLVNPGSVEPADLVWACHNTIILFYANQNIHGKIPKPELAQKRWQIAVGHNLNQAKKWFLLWKEGKHITGKNSFQEFSIRYKDYKHKIVVSIVDTHLTEPHLQSEVHSNFKNELEITECITIPTIVLELMMSNYLSLYDFLIVLKAWKEHAKLVQKNQISFQNLVLDYTQREKIKLAEQVIVVHEDLDKDIRAAQTIIETAKAIYKNKESALIAGQILSDTRLSDMQTLITKMHNVRLVTKLSENNYAGSRFDGTNYSFIVAHAHTANFHIICPQIVEQMDLVPVSQRGCVCALTASNHSEIFFYFELKNAPSNIEILLKTW